MMKNKNSEQKLIGNKNMLKGIIDQHKSYYYAIIMSILMIRAFIVGFDLGYYLYMSEYLIGIALTIYSFGILLLLFIFAMILYSEAGSFLIRRIFLKKDQRYNEIIQESEQVRKMFFNDAKMERMHTRIYLPLEDNIVPSNM